MTWWKRLILVGYVFLALGLYILPLLFQQVAIIYQFPKQWIISLGLLLIYQLYSMDLSRKVKSARRTRNLSGEYTASFVCYGYKKEIGRAHV